MNLTDVKSKIATAIKEKQNINIYSEYKGQDVTAPCIFINLISSYNLDIANVNCGRVYRLDLIYLADNYSKNCDFTDIEDVLNNLKIDGIYIEHKESTIVDKELHHELEVTVYSNKLSEIECKNTTYKAVLDNLKALHGYVYYLQGDITNLDKGFFVVEPQEVSTESSSINTQKDYTRNIAISYATSNEDIIKSDIPSYLEEVLDELIKNMLRKSKVYKANYSLDLYNTDTEYNGISITSYKATLEVVERK